MKKKYLIILLLLSLITPNIYAQFRGGFNKIPRVSPLARAKLPKLERIPVYHGAPVPVLPVAGKLPSAISAGSINVERPQLNLKLNQQLAASQHPLITNTALIGEAVSGASPAQVENIRAVLSQIWDALLVSPGEWNFRRHAEMLLGAKQLKLDVHDTLLDVLTLEQYVLHTGKWPRDMQNPREVALSKKASAALRTNYKDYVVSLRKRATNIPSTAATMTQAERFIATHKRIPGVVYLQARNVREPLQFAGGLAGIARPLSPSLSEVELKYVSQEEKLLGIDLQFLVETNIVADAGQESASLARLRDLWNCYADINFMSDIPEVSTDGKPNIPVLSTAQWQHKLNRWVYSQPAVAFLYPARSYKQLLKDHEQGWEEAITQARKEMSVEEFSQWSESVQLEQEKASQFDTWPDIEKDEALLHAAQLMVKADGQRRITPPQLTQEEWEEEARLWMQSREALTPVPTDVAFDKLTPKQQAQLLLQAIYEQHISPVEFLRQIKHPIPTLEFVE